MKIREVVLGITIAIIFLMFCVFGTKLVYDAPKYEDYCNYSLINPVYNSLPDSNETELEVREKAIESQRAYEECYKEYSVAEKEYSKNMFIISLIFGILVISICAIFISINSISGGLMFGSLMFIIYGTGRYWSYMDDLMRFIILGIALGVLIYVSYWANKHVNKRRKDLKNKSKYNKNEKRKR